MFSAAAVHGRGDRDVRRGFRRKPEIRLRTASFQELGFKFHKALVRVVRPNSGQYDRYVPKGIPV